MGLLWGEYDNTPPVFYIGKVVNNYDKDRQGMVQVSVYAFKDKANVTEWMRVMSPFAGDKSGLYFLPDVGNEVIVAFIGGDINHPFVLGCLWSGNKYPDKTVTEKNTVKKIITKSGIEIMLNEEEKKEQIKLSTPKGLNFTISDETETVTAGDKDGKNCVVVDIKNKTVSVKSADKLTIDMKSGVVKASDSIDLSAKDIKISASNNLTLKGGSKIEASGGQAEFKGSGKTQISGAQTEVKAGASLKLEGSAITEIKGGLVKING